MNTNSPFSNVSSFRFTRILPRFRDMPNLRQEIQNPHLEILLLSHHIQYGLHSEGLLDYSFLTGRAVPVIGAGIALSDLFAKSKRGDTCVTVREYLLQMHQHFWTGFLLRTLLWPPNQKPGTPSSLKFIHFRFCACCVN